MNLHLHDHAVVSDGVFHLDNGILRFSTAPPPTFEEVAPLVEDLRRRILKRMLRMRMLAEETISEMLAWPHGGFSLDGGTYVEAQDRAGLERLLLYVLRPALSLKQLTYAPEQDLVRYRPSKGKPDSPAVLEWTGAEFAWVTFLMIEFGTLTRAGSRVIIMGVSVDPAAPSAKLILIIDDDESMRDFMDYTVKKDGFRTDRAADGREALRKIEISKPDLIVLDFMIPGMGGYEVLRELQARGCGDIPIVVVTGRLMDDKSIEMVRQESNVKEFLQKPFRRGMIEAALHRILGTSPPHSPRQGGAGGTF